MRVEHTPFPRAKRDLVGRHFVVTERVFHLVDVGTVWEVVSAPGGCLFIKNAVGLQLQIRYLASWRSLGGFALLARGGCGRVDCESSLTHADRAGIGWCAEHVGAGLAPIVGSTAMHEPRPPAL